MYYWCNPGLSSHTKVLMFAFKIEFQCNSQGIDLRFCTINSLSTNGSDLLYLLVQSSFCHLLSILASFPNYQFGEMGMHYCCLSSHFINPTCINFFTWHAEGSTKKSESLINVYVCVHLLFQVKNIFLQLEPFSIENGLLTPTLKAKRGELSKYFRTQINSLYENIQE